MKILFIHQNFPGQYKHLAPALAAAGHECRALTLRAKEPGVWQGVELVPYRLRARKAQAVQKPAGELPPFDPERMRTKASSSRSSRTPITGRRPMNSGMRPYFKRSSG